MNREETKRSLFLTLSSEPQAHSVDVVNRVDARRIVGLIGFPQRRADLLRRRLTSLSRAEDYQLAFVTPGSKH